MGTVRRHTPGIPPAQQAIRDKCYHSTGTFIEFGREEIEQSIPDRFEKQVDRYPNRLAVRNKGEELTYSELNSAANKLAHAILAMQGNGRKPITLLLEHDAIGIVAILGVLKAGKCYVGLDSSYPPATLASTLEDSQAGLLVTNSRNLVLAQSLSQLRLINLDEPEYSLSDENPGMRIAPENPASIIYTSGSTGRPKGVIQNHLSLLQSASHYTNDVHICPDDRLSLLNYCGASASSWNIYGALLNGATVFPYDLRAEGLTGLVDWLTNEQITMLHLNPPSLFRYLVDNLAQSNDFPKLRLIRFAGEAVYKSDVDHFKTHFSPDCILQLSFASSETNAALQFFIDRETVIGSRTVPLGYPVADKEILLLDEQDREVGVNQIGEIAVKSRYLSPGYWRRPDLSEAAFLPDPEGGPERIYRTGDLGQLLPDGRLKHLGRKDFQTKILGNRVDLAELEMAFLELDSIKAAVIHPQEDSKGLQQLVAYLVPANLPAPAVASLRHILAQRLPGYMVPSRFVMLDSLPLLANGKVDRQALPEPSRARPELESPFVPPQTPVEESLAKIWAEVLGLDQVGIHDNFLELGGDSLLASQVVSRVVKTFQVDLPLRLLFEAPTVAEMGLALIQGQAKKVDHHDLERTVSELESLPEASL